jgi:hypothetical protein
MEQDLNDLSVKAVYFKDQLNYYIHHQQDAKDQHEYYH